MPITLWPEATGSTIVEDFAAFEAGSQFAGVVEEDGFCGGGAGLGDGGDAAELEFGPFPHGLLGKIHIGGDQGTVPRVPDKFHVFHLVFLLALLIHRHEGAFVAQGIVVGDGDEAAFLDKAGREDAFVDLRDDGGLGEGRLGAVHQKLRLAVAEALCRVAGIGEFVAIVDVELGAKGLALVHDHGLAGLVEPHDVAVLEHKLGLRRACEQQLVVDLSIDLFDLVEALGRGYLGTNARGGKANQDNCECELFHSCGFGVKLGEFAENGKWGCANGMNWVWQRENKRVSNSHQVVLLGHPERQSLYVCQGSKSSNGVFHRRPSLNKVEKM